MASKSPPSPLPILHLRDAGHRLGTYASRVRDLLAARGIEPTAFGRGLVITEEQFREIAEEHARNPPRPRGNPKFRGRPKSQSR